MTSNHSFFFILKVLLVSGFISITIKYVLGNFDLIDKTDWALPIVITPTLIVFFVLIYRTIVPKNITDN